MLLRFNFPVSMHSCVHVIYRLSLASSFDQQAAGAMLDLDGDEESSQRRMKNIKRW